mmetsp:Transcript_10897/g.15709  ORF Transcript_10897/g.15709 Transcript_10897/m.15709 type:complete len:158 (-) Transcript_10897:591-1064(-)
MRRSLIRLSSTETGRGIWEDIKKRVTTGKFLRPNDVDDVSKSPAKEHLWRYPSPGDQPEASVPQGDYEKVFNISYYDRDARRHHAKENVAVEVKSAGCFSHRPSAVLDFVQVNSELPPTPAATYVQGEGISGDNFHAEERKRRAAHLSALEAKGAKE